ncbi:MAG: hypothetical protein CL928_12085 [Deltaproteobacteria bacterium]|nr:hypothetical protein [Deltaproteobacteria bacterium]
MLLRFYGSRLSLMGLLIVFVGLLSAEAQAQPEPSLDVQRLMPASSVRGFAAVEDARIFQRLRPGFDLYLAYAHRPLQQADAARRRTSGVVDGLISAHLRAGFAFSTWAQLDVHLPFLQSIIKGQSFSEYSDPDAGPASLGDLWLVGKFRILAEETAVGIAVLPFVTFPTGDRDLFTTSGVPTLGVRAAFSRRWRVFHWAAHVGYRFKPSGVVVAQSAASDDEILFAAGVGLTPVARWLDVNLEVVGAGIVGESLEEAQGYEGKRIIHTPIELVGNVKLMTPIGLDVVLGGGPGLTGGIGTPIFRVFMGVSWSSKTDQDGDGIVNRKDQCPLAREDVDGYNDSDGCPEPDNDMDGFFDALDHCPVDAEDLDGFEDEDGCPEVDNDGDGVFDEEDRCPDEAEDMDGHRDHDGCPEPDNDYDGIADDQDACPLVKEDRDDFEDLDGCPEGDNDGDGIEDMDDYCPEQVGGGGPSGCPDDVKAVVRGDKILILEKIHFTPREAQIVERSLQVLESVRDRLLENPSILKVRIEGHTDEQETPAYNQQLSEERARAVMRQLMMSGVEGARMEAVGYGETRPFGDNTMEAGRALNRRVEFFILEQLQPAELPAGSAHDPETETAETGSSTASSAEIVGDQDVATEAGHVADEERPTDASPHAEAESSAPAADRAPEEEESAP